jgi:hypothetical protein
MFRRVSVIAMSALIASAVPALAGPGTINHRQARQQGRIYQGIASGELTRREARRLESQESRIAVQEARARHSGNGLSPREHRMLERDLSRESRHIYRQKHDGQDR